MNVLAAKHGVAVILVTHTNKKTGGTYRDKVNGSTGWTDAARATFLFTVDKDDVDKRIMSAGKINAARKAKAVSFRVVEKPHQTAGSAITIDWLEEIDLTADQILQMPQEDGEKISTAKDMLLEKLADGKPVLSSILDEEAKKLNISRATLNRAKKAIGVGYKHDGRADIWSCYLPVTKTENTLPLETENPDAGSPF
jgi:hypothetical protein